MIPEALSTQQSGELTWIREISFLKPFFSEWFTTVGNWGSISAKTFSERHCRIFLLDVKMFGYLSTVSYPSLVESCPKDINPWTSLLPCTWAKLVHFDRERHGKPVQKPSAHGLQEGLREYGWDPDNVSYINRRNEGQKEKPWETL